MPVAGAGLGGEPELGPEAEQVGVLDHSWVFVLGQAGYTAEQVVGLVVSALVLEVDVAGKIFAFLFRVGSVL